MNKKRPKFLALHQIKLPLPGVVSILHRISGALLFLALPAMLWLFQCSLTSIETYSELRQVMAHPALKLLSLGVMWAFLHHFCAGVRYLLIDLNVASGLAAARSSSRWVLAVSALLTVWLGVELW